MIKVKLNKYNLGLLLAIGLSASTLSGCSIVDSQPEKQYEIVLDDLSGYEDTEVMNYVNSVPFSDPSFRDAVYNYISNSPLRETELAHGLRTDNLNLSNVSSLTDLRLYPNLKGLTIDNSNINDFNALSDMKLNKISFNNMNIDVSQLANINADAVEFYHCNITNLEQLPDNVEYLYIVYSKGDSLNFINNMKKLRGVVLNNANVSDVESLNNRKLESLTINDMQINDWSFLNDITSLKSLNVAYTNFEDINNISELSKLEDVAFDYCHLKSIDGIENHKKIESISLDSCFELDSYNKLTMLPNLKTAVLTNLEMIYDPATAIQLEQNGIDMSATYEDQAIKNKVIDLYNTIGITDDMSEEEKVRKICLKVQDTIDIPDEHGEEQIYDFSMNLLKSGLDGYGVCNTYSGMTKAFLDLAGIKNHTIVGECIQDCEDILHVWNVVCIDGKWYGIDNTFLEEEPNAYENISNKKDSQFYMDALDEEEWVYYHMPYYMPQDTLQEYYQFAK